MSDERWYYCLQHKSVERSDDVCRAIDRLGPYETHGQAMGALDTVQRRNDEWENDPRYRDDEPADERAVDVDDDGYDIIDELHPE